jgi:hypothetical protein
MAIDTMDKLIAALGDSLKCRFYKPSLSNATAGQLHSLWRSNGFPSQGAIPGAAAVCDSSLVGSWPLPDPGTNKMNIAKMSASTSVISQLIIMDRLAHMGGLVGNVTTSQAVNLSIATPASQGRCGAGGQGVLWCLEWYADTGGTAVTATVTYTNDADVTGRTTTVALAATRRVSTLLPILPNVDDLRIKSIQSVQLSATTGSAGNFGVTAMARQVECPLPIVGVGALLDFAQTGLETVTKDNCLFLAIVAGGTATGNVLGSFEIVQG